MPLINNSIFALASSGNVLPAVITGILVLFVTAPLTWFIAIENRKRNYEAKVGSAEEKARGIIDEAYKTAETTKKESLLEVKEESIRAKNDLEKEIKEHRYLFVTFIDAFDHFLKGSRGSPFVIN